MTYRAAGSAGQAIRLGDLRCGGSVTRHWSTTPADDAEGEIPFVAPTLFDVHKAGSDCVRDSRPARIRHDGRVTARQEGRR